MIVITGKDKGKTGKITKIQPIKSRAIVAGINKFKKHQKPDNNQAGGIIEKEMPIHISNLAFYDASRKKGVRFGFKFEGPDIKVVSKPFSFKDFAISYPCFPLDLFDINLTGSIYSCVGPAVTRALNFLLFSKFLK